MNKPVLRDEFKHCGVRYNSKMHSLYVQLLANKDTLTSLFIYETQRNKWICEQWDYF